VGANIGFGFTVYQCVPTKGFEFKTSKLYDFQARLKKTTIFTMLGILTHGQGDKTVAVKL